MSPIDGSTRPEGGPFGSLAVAGLLTVGIGAFCALAVLAAYAPDLRNDARGGGSALSRSAVGFAGLVDLLRDTGVSVTVSRDPPSGKRRADELLVLTPPPDHGGEAVRTAAAAAEAVIVVLPKWTVAPDEDHPGWVTRTGLAGLAEAAHPLPAAGTLQRRQGPGRPTFTAGGACDFDDLDPAPAPVEDLQTLDLSGDWQPCLVDETGRTVLAQLSDDETYVLADPDLLDTLGLKDGGAARTAAGLIEGLRGGRPVVFDVTLNGFGKVRGLLRLLFDPPLFGGTLCAAAAGLAILLMAVRRFGPVRPADRSIALGKRALADNAARLIARAGREPAMAGPYASALRAAVARSMGLRPGPGAAAPDAALDALAAALRLPDAYPDLAREAAAVHDRAALMRVADRLHRWGQGMIRGYR